MSGRVWITLFSLWLAATGFTQAEGRSLPPPNPERGSIGLSLRVVRLFALGGSVPASRVYFVRLEDEGDALAGEYVLVSNHSGKGQVYFLNAKPGRYVAVAAEFLPGAPSRHIIFLSKESISKTEVTVLAGGIVFMGDFLVNAAPEMENADSAQAHYYRMISPENADKNPFMGAGKVNYTGTLNAAARGAAREREFWDRARKKMFKKQPAWAELVRTKSEGEQ